MSTTSNPPPPPSPNLAAEAVPGTAARDAETGVPPELAADSLRDYLHAAFVRFRGGQAGALPVIGGMVVIAVLFQSLNSEFLTAGNLVNLLVQAAVFSVLAMAEVFVLLLGEIDLSIGYVAAVGGVIMADLVSPSHHWPWWSAITAALLACAGIGLLQGVLVARVRLPSFVVTLGGLLFWEGVMLRILGDGGTIPINNSVINDIASANLSPTAGWIVMLALVALFAAVTTRRDRRRRRTGLAAQPPAVTALKVLLVLAGGVALVLLCNTNRGVLVPIAGVPWVVLLVIAVLVAWTFLLGRTKLGRYIYAIGGNAEAARRAGIDVARVRTITFMLTSFTAGIAGVIYASRLRSISTAVDGGTLVLYAVAAAVIGGTSLFGGRGRALHGVIGGIVIAGIDNGMGLLGFSASSKYMVTALVLIAAVTIDVVARRGRAVTA